MGSPVVHPKRTNERGFIFGLVCCPPQRTEEPMWGPQTCTNPLLYTSEALPPSTGL